MDSRWESEHGASAAPNRYQLRISGGAVQVNLDSEAKEVAVVKPDVPTKSSGELVSALAILLDGVESRVRSRSAR
jgi:hypothetical protein